MAEWRIAGVPQEFLNQLSYQYVYHNHDNYLFVCLPFRKGVMCGLCGTRIPEYLNIQLKLLDLSAYIAYPFAPSSFYRVSCVFNNEKLTTSLTKNGYWLNTTLKEEHRIKLKDLYEKYRDIWQEILL